MTRSPRRGFTMLTVLWVMSLAGIVAMTGMIVGRNAAGAGRNRVEWQRAYWRALGCARRAQSAADGALAGKGADDAQREWRTLSATIAGSAAVAGCEVVVEAAGTRIDINGATAEMFDRALTSCECSGGGTIGDAVVASRDSQPFADVHDLARVAGVTDGEGLDSMFSAEPGRVSLATAPVAVLTAVPGITPEAADAIVARRQAGDPIGSLGAILGTLSQFAATALIDRFPDAVRVTTPDPDAWVVRAVARSGFPVNTAVVDLRLLRSTRGVDATMMRAR